ALRSALAAARLAPAVAMQPPAPPRFSHSVLDGALAALRLSQSARMVARSFLRWPLRSALTILGMALAVGVLIASTFMYDALDKIIDTAFYQSNRQDAVLMFAEDVPEKALIEVAHLPGTLQVEGQQFHAAVLRNGPLSKRVPIEARRPEADLSRIVDGDGRVLNPPEGGILMARRLARQLELGLGDTVEVEFLTGRRETFEMTVSGMLDQYFGLGAYVDLVYLNSLFRQTPQVTVANVSLDETQIEALHLAIKTLPELTGTVMMNDTRRSFEETIEENVLIMNTIYISIATLITIGVAYNGARIQLSERARELASLRILGFTRGEVSFILIAESLTLALLAQPLGWLIGAGIARAMTASFTSDLYAIPLVLEPSTFARASFFVLLAALGSVLVVRQRLDRLDLVSVMKTRE
ncbi:MAG: ABC transporter permease, partial [Gammaproteobacteria bacterium]|nr:ABC transporter permease [Gammaproteobacteria bacterium]